MLFVGFFALTVGTAAKWISVDRQAEWGQSYYRDVQLLAQAATQYGAGAAPHLSRLWARHRHGAPAYLSSLATPFQDSSR